LARELLADHFEIQSSLSLFVNFHQSPN
jgi:hypothetical protein